MDFLKINLVMHSLPENMWVLIYNFLNPSDRKILRQTQKFFYNSINRFFDYNALVITKSLMFPEKFDTLSHFGHWLQVLINHLTFKYQNIDTLVCLNKRGLFQFLNWCTYPNRFKRLIFDKKRHWDFFGGIYNTVNTFIHFSVESVEIEINQLSKLNIIRDLLTFNIFPQLKKLSISYSPDIKGSSCGEDYLIYADLDKYSSTRPPISNGIKLVFSNICVVPIYFMNENSSEIVEVNKTNKPRRVIYTTATRDYDCLSHSTVGFKHRLFLDSVTIDQKGKIKIDDETGSIQQMFKCDLTVNKRNSNINQIVFIGSLSPLMSHKKKNIDEKSKCVLC
jgi:hypothetical protein